MIDLRLYRYALLAVPLVAVIAMFSLQGVPRGLSAGIPPDAFDPASAAPLAKELATSAPYPTPGSAADQKLGDQVKSHFAAIDGASVSEQTFDGSFDGHDVHLRNLIATLPGESNRQIALIAPRDVGRGSGATTSVASTAALLEIAEAFSGSAHHKTLVFVSTDGSSIGALGTRRFISDYSDSSLLDAAIVLSQPALENPTAPLVIPWSTGPQSTASQLAETANSTVSKELAMPAGDEGPLDDLFRLALPAGLGEQGPLVEAGLPAVAAVRRWRAAGRIRPRCARVFRQRHLRPVRARRTVADPRPRLVTGCGRARPQGLHRRRRQPDAGLDDRTAGSLPADPGDARGRVGNRLGGAEPDRGGPRIRLVAAARRSVPRRPARAPARHACRFAAQPRVPVRPPYRGPRDRRGHLGDRRAPLLLRGLVLPAAAASAAGQRGRHRGPGGAASGLSCDARRLVRQPVSRAGRLGRPAGLGAGGGQARTGPAPSRRPRSPRPGARGRPARRSRRALRRRIRRLARPGADGR